MRTLLTKIWLRLTGSSHADQQTDKQVRQYLENLYADKRGPRTGDVRWQ